MSLSDDVRDYCIINIIYPARKNGYNQISIRAGDIHKAMNYKNRMPLVCGAIGTNKFEELANVKKLSEDGPTNGANKIFKFKIL